MSIASRIEALVAQNPGIGREDLFARVEARLGSRTHVPEMLEELVAGKRIALRDGGYWLAGAVPPGGEYSGRDGPDPVRFGDWESKGICVDF